VRKYLGQESSEQPWDRELDPCPFQFPLIASIATTTLSSGIPPSPGESDELPPFHTLSTEDLWQKKAERQLPGTFFVVANSASFARTDEYRQPTRQPLGTAHDSNTEVSACMTVDASTVILNKFEDTSRYPSHTTASAPKGDVSCPSTPSTTSPVTIAQDPYALTVSPFDVTGVYPSTLELQTESYLEYHWRTVVIYHIIQPYDRFEDGFCPGLTERFEQESERFTPV
jgi:hypothetical protein